MSFAASSIPQHGTTNSGMSFSWILVVPLWNQPPPPWMY